MSRKRCAHRGLIERLFKTGNIWCHKRKRDVPIIIDAKGNRCTDKNCPYSTKENTVKN